MTVHPSSGSSARIGAEAPERARELLVLRALAEDVTEPVLALRARMVLLCLLGAPSSEVALELGCSRQTVATWRARFRADGVGGLRDAPRQGRPVTLNPAVVVVRTLQPPGDGRSRWSTRRLAADLGISNVSVGAVWRQWGIRPEPAGRVALLTEPVLDAVIVDVLGLFVSRSTVLFAVAVGEPRRRAGAAVGLGRVAGDLLPGIAGRGPSGDELPPAEFLDRLEVQLRARASEPRLLVQGDATACRWAHERAVATVHVIPPHLAWDRVVRVGCLITGADEQGAASVGALRTAITGHAAGGAFGWVRGAGVAPDPVSRATGP
ncbi:helix-turn-helix domain containing protein [Pseudonocardia sp. KRD-184]|uniref:Helix-turn-helix domain containing protein n=1 Tax=Pseudonocardia oceani TaxID=2792013 RepID=A0ABS6UH00_9PSEU|nr:helix-turn-helix domain-containing protein [Pseudonocardia oceani]MBW0093139.1 helix-turn-helix domain containing protein [Pseudonocardia oceani]MBW0098740.1 helix-turn-helix domain containing protein [Pseudonocardia oceani]MBW0109853.1 helix-turn-helix domain containing protein [Pseudonocardia oceani]MBW0120076.1 helix-turn-helix domain containing protein [Pseudonocardia oceani]MBW0131496.1 helix-turn-helix domain containing protein [Pseudonocardia oceani]